MMDKSRTITWGLGFFCVVFILFLIILRVDTAAAHDDEVCVEIVTASSVANNVLQAELVQSTGSNSFENQQPHHGENQLGTILPLWSCVPFACMLFSIALLPLILPEFWHHHFGKISAFWAICMGIPFVGVYKGIALYEIAHILLADYVPFMILLWSLYTVSGGVLLKGSLKGTPAVNVAMLSIGTLLASFMGTTGAAMLIIRPLLRANSHRKNRTFMVVFFIFLVANVGGSLTPLGDPPLFLGFLHGVSFFWTMKIAPHTLTLVFFLLTIYTIIDCYYYYYKQDGVSEIKEEGKIPLRLEGIHNFVFLLGIIAAVLMSGMMNWGSFDTFGVHRAIQDWVRDIILVFMGLLSMLTTSKQIREGNSFTWFPIIEVAYLFIGIFVTMVPCLLILKAGAEGGLSFLINSVQKPTHYFWVTGALSGFLDNAPTYLTFFSTALGSCYPGIEEAQAVKLLMTENAIFLQAISAAAVFFGACSYIGNAPNFMVRSIAEEAGTPMPSFFGYIFKYSLVFLLPAFLLISIIYF